MYLLYVPTYLEAGEWPVIDSPNYCCVVAVAISVSIMFSRPLTVDSFHPELLPPSHTHVSSSLASSFEYALKIEDNDENRQCSLFLVANVRVRIVTAIAPLITTIIQFCLR